MLSMDPQTMTERENHKFLIGSIIPRPIAFVTSESEEGVLNGAPFSFFNVVSSNPPMISLSVQRSGRNEKDTARNIKKRKEFVIHVVDEHNLEKINATAASVLPSQSEVQLVGLTSVESVNISVPGIREAKVRMECVLEHAFELGDGDTPGCDLLIGRVVQYHIENDIYENGRIEPRGIGAISRLAGHDYAKVGDIFTKERPK